MSISPVASKTAPLLSSFQHPTASPAPRTDLVARERLSDYPALMPGVLSSHRVIQIDPEAVREQEGNDSRLGRLLFGALSIALLATGIAGLTCNRDSTFYQVSLTTIPVWVIGGCASGLFAICGDGGST